MRPSKAVDMRFTILFLGLAASTIAGCTIETTSTNPTPPAPSSEDPSDNPPQKPGDVTPPKEEEPWTSWSVPAEVRQMTCPTSESVHVATAKGLYTLTNNEWKLAAAGDFKTVHLHDASSGFAGGDALLWQRAGGGWAALDGAASMKI